MAAEARIQALVDPAITQLAQLIEDADSDSVKLSAIKDVLDRAGYKPTEKQEQVHTFKAVDREMMESL